MTATRRTPRSRAAETTAALPAWAALCFFASGAAGLLYEVVWAKQLSYVLGNSLQAVSAVVAAFLGGLALGARFLGPALAKRGEGARIYAALELGVAVLGLISLPLCRGLDPLVGALYRSLGGEGTPFAIARLGLLFVLLVPPAALMGATLPVLVGRFERGRVGPILARLYALNTFGAVAGTVAGGFVLMPALGLAATTWVAAGLNLVAALVAWNSPSLRNARGAAAAPEAAKTRSPNSGLLEGRAHAAFALLFLFSGFAALAYQISWVRIFTLVFGSSVYSFSAVLGVYLLGLALGSAAVEGWLRRGSSLAAFGWLQLALAATALPALIACSHLTQSMYELVQRSGMSWSKLLAGEVGMLAALLLVPCALLGATFPLGAQLLQRRDPEHAAGLAYGVNTLGTIAGSLAVGFVAIPVWGVRATYVVTLFLSAAVGVGVLALGYRRRELAGRHLSLAAAAFVAVGALALVAPQWNPSLMSAGVYRPIQAQNLTTRAEEAGGVGPITLRATRAERVLFYHEGIHGSVLVGSDPQDHQRWLRIGGKIEASTGTDMETQVLLGMIPAACADSGARTLVIGLGSGITLSGALAAGAGPTEVVELEPCVVQASRFFHAQGEHPLDDPRVRVVFGDARTHLAHAGAPYGMIVSEPSNPWMAGVNNLFTVDFYRLARAHLEPRGVFCQWLQLYELSPRTLASLLASFLEVFPEGQAYRMRSDLVLVATPASARLALDRLRSPESRRVLRRAKIASPEALAGYYAGPLASLRDLTRGAPLNSDDLPIVEYRAPRDLVAAGTSAAFVHPLARGLVKFPEPPPKAPLFSAWSLEGWFETRARKSIEEEDLPRAEATVRAARDAGFAPLALRLTQEIATVADRGQSLVEAERARALFAAGRDAEGLQVLRAAAALDPSNARIQLWIADRRRLAGDLAGAEADLMRWRTHVGSATPADPIVQSDAALISGMLEIDRSHPLVAAARFREMQRWSPRRVDGYLYEARARAAGGDSLGAKDALHRGLRRLPGEADLSNLLVSMGGSP